MNKIVIFSSLATIFVAIGVGLYAIDYADNYALFADPKYAHNLSTATEDNIRPIFSLSDKHVTVDSSYPDYTFEELLDNSDSVIIGSIENISYIEDPYDSTSDFIIVSTNYHINIDENLKGSLYDDVVVTVYGGQSGSHVTPYDDEMFVFQKGDVVLLMIGDVGMSKSEIAKLGIDEPNFEWTPTTPSGMYKILGNEPDREVHKYGESIFIPLSDFKSMIRSIVD